MNAPQFPEVTNELLRELDKRFPERCPDPKDSEREVWMKAGERRLVRFLHQQAKLQQQRKVTLNVQER